jgi:hypothetical protein
MRLLPSFIVVSFLAAASFGAVVNQIGSYSNWPTSWTSLGGYDADNGLTETLDFVGNATDPGLYYARSSSYIFFRMRVDEGTFPSTPPNGAYLLLIDIANYGTNGIDYAFAWDSKSKIADHGLEMCVRAVNGPTWGVSQVDDIDRQPSVKATNDINGLISGSTYRTTDGYVRTTDGQNTTSFGTTTFIDFAVKWSYLETYTDLRSNQTWNVGLASIANATDHNAFNADIGNNAGTTSSVTTGWQAVPEPTVVSLISLTGVMALIGRRIFDRFFG